MTPQNSHNAPESGTFEKRVYFPMLACLLAFLVTGAILGGAVSSYISMGSAVVLKYQWGHPAARLGFIVGGCAGLLLFFVFAVRASLRRSARAEAQRQEDGIRMRQEAAQEAAARRQCEKTRKAEEERAAYLASLDALAAANKSEPYNPANFGPRPPFGKFRWEIEAAKAEKSKKMTEYASYWARSTFEEAYQQIALKLASEHGITRQEEVCRVFAQAFPHFSFAKDWRLRTLKAHRSDPRINAIRHLLP